MLDTVSKRTKIFGGIKLLFHALSIGILIMTLIMMNENFPHFIDYIENAANMPIPAEMNDEFKSFFIGVFTFTIIITVIFFIIHIVFYTRLYKGYISKPYMIIILIFAVISLFSTLGNINNPNLSVIKNKNLIFIVDFIPVIVTILYASFALVDKSKTHYSAREMNDNPRYRSPIRGITFQLPGKWDNYLYNIFKDIDMEDYHLEIIDKNIIFDDCAPKSEIEEYNSDKIIKYTGSYYLVSLNARLKYKGSTSYAIHSYNDFLNSPYELIIMISDSTLVEIYCKKMSIVEVIKENAILHNYRNIQYIDKSNDHGQMFEYIR